CLHAVEEGGAALRILVLRRRAPSAGGAAVVKIISQPPVPPDSILVMKPDVKPDRRVKCAVLIHAKPGQLVVKNLGRFGIREIAVGDAPVGARPRHPMDQLADRSFAAALMRIGPV